MKDDERCCGSGACIINDQGYCWCGQRWDGGKMCYPVSENRPYDLEDNLGYELPHVRSVCYTVDD